jgi:hypothetical protein
MAYIYILALQFSQPLPASFRLALPIRKQVQREPVAEHLNISANHP